MNAPSSLTKEQLRALHSLFHVYAPRFVDGVDGGANADDARAARLSWASKSVGREIGSFSDLQFREAARLISTMKAALGQEEIPAERSRRPRPNRAQARAYGTAGRRNQSSNEVQLMDSPTLNCWIGCASSSAGRGNSSMRSCMGSILPCAPARSARSGRPIARFGR